MITILLVLAAIVLVVVILRVLPARWRAAIIGAGQTVSYIIWGILQRIPRPALVFLGTLGGTVFIFGILGTIVHLVAFYKGGFESLKILFAVDFLVGLSLAFVANALPGKGRTIIRSISLILMVHGILILLMMKGPVFYQEHLTIIWFVAVSLLMLLVGGFYTNKTGNTAMYILMGVYVVLALSFISIKSLDERIEGWKLKDEQSATHQKRASHEVRQDIAGSQVQVLAPSTKIWKKANGKFEQMKDQAGKYVWAKQGDWLTVVSHGDSVIMYGATPLTEVVMAITNPDFKVDTVFVKTFDHSEEVVPEAGNEQKGVTKNGQGTNQQKLAISVKPDSAGVLITVRNPGKKFFALNFESGENFRIRENEETAIIQVHYPSKYVIITAEGVTQKIVATTKVENGDRIIEVS